MVITGVYYALGFVVAALAVQYLTGPIFAIPTNYFPTQILTRLLTNTVAGDLQSEDNPIWLQ
jgi:hypothetical protein